MPIYSDMPTIRNHKGNKKTNKINKANKKLAKQNQKMKKKYAYAYA